MAWNCKKHTSPMVGLIDEPQCAECRRECDEAAMEYHAKMFKSLVEWTRLAEEATDPRRSI